MTKFKPEIHKRLFERIKAGHFIQLKREPMGAGLSILPPELKFIGDKKPYIIYGEEFKTKKLSKIYGNGAKEHFLKQIKPLPMDVYLNEYHTRHIMNMMDRYYRLPENWRKYRPYVVGIIYTLGDKCREHTFKFYLNKTFNNDPANIVDSGDIMKGRIINPGVLGSCVCFESFNVHEDAHNKTFVAKMFRSTVEEQILRFRRDVNAQPGIHQVHHDKISFLEIMLGFARNVLKISDRNEFEKQMRPLGKYVSSEGPIFNLNIPKAVMIQETFQKYHQRKSYLIKTLKKSHQTETSEDTKFNTSLRNELKEVE